MAVDQNADRTTQAAQLAEEVREFLAAHDPASTEPLEFLRARYDAGLAWVNFPEGLGGKGLDRSLQADVNDAFVAAGAPDNNSGINTIGLGMAAPTILAFADDETKKRLLRPLWTGEEVWCQMFSEPGAGSDLAGLGTSAVKQENGDWLINGQKVWTSIAHHADHAILVTRSDPNAVKHRGMTYFWLEMKTPGVEVRPLRQITGQAEFNEIFLDDVVIPDAQRLGEVGQGWAVAQTTLMNERVAIGGKVAKRGEGAIGEAVETWESRSAEKSPALRDQLLASWVEAEALRLAQINLGQKLAVGAPGPEGSAVKLGLTSLTQRLTGLELEMMGDEGLRYDNYTMGRPDLTNRSSRVPGFRYLRWRGLSIEGGTSEIMRNIISERVLGLPPEPRIDKDVPWKDLPR